MRPSGANDGTAYAKDSNSLRRNGQRHEAKRNPACTVCTGGIGQTDREGFEPSIRFHVYTLSRNGVICPTPAKVAHGNGLTISANRFPDRPYPELAALGGTIKAQSRVLARVELFKLCAAAPWVRILQQARQGKRKASAAGHRAYSFFGATIRSAGDSRRVNR